MITFNQWMHAFYVFYHVLYESKCQEAIPTVNLCEKRIKIFSAQARSPQNSWAQVIRIQLTLIQTKNAWNETPMYEKTYRTENQSMCRIELPYCTLHVKATSIFSPLCSSFDMFMMYFHVTEWTCSITHAHSLYEQLQTGLRSRPGDQSCIVVCYISAFR